MQTWATISCISHSVTKTNSSRSRIYCLTEKPGYDNVCRNSLRCEAGKHCKSLRRPRAVRNVGGMRCGAGQSPHV